MGQANSQAPQTQPLPIQSRSTPSQSTRHPHEDCGPRRNILEPLLNIPPVLANIISFLSLSEIQKIPLLCREFAQVLKSNDCWIEAYDFIQYISPEQGPELTPLLKNYNFQSLNIHAVKKKLPARYSHSQQTTDTLSIKDTKRFIKNLATRHHYIKRLALANFGVINTNLLGTIMKNMKHLSTLNIQDELYPGDLKFLREQLSNGREEYIHLKELDLSRCKLHYNLDFDQLTHLIQSSNVHIEKLRMCGLGSSEGRYSQLNLDAFIGSMCGILLDSNIKELYLSSNFIRVTQLQQLLKSLRNNYKIEILNISYCHGIANEPSTESIAALCELLSSKHCALRHLYLSKCQITDTLGEKIAAALISNKSLQVLSLNQNALGTSFERAIAEVIQRDTCPISQLMLSSNSLTGEFLFPALESNTHLHVLSLSSNNIVTIPTKTKTIGRLRTLFLNNNNNFDSMQIFMYIDENSGQYLRELSLKETACVHDAKYGIENIRKGLGNCLNLDTLLISTVSVSNIYHSTFGVLKLEYTNEILKMCAENILPIKYLILGSIQVQDYDDIRTMLETNSTLVSFQLDRICSQNKNVPNISRWIDLFQTKNSTLRDFVLDPGSLAFREMPIRGYLNPLLQISS